MEFFSFCLPTVEKRSIKTFGHIEELSKKDNKICALIFRLLARKPNLENCYIHSNKFFHNFHLPESSFTCPWLRASGLARRLRKWMMFENFVSVDDNKVNKKNIIFYNPFIIVDDIELLNVGE